MTECATENRSAAWSGAQWRQALTEMPKAHLHLHLGGACPYNLWRRFDAVSPPRSLNVVRDGFEVFERHGRSARRPVYGQLSIELLVQELAAEAVDLGVVWMELSIDPTLWDERWVAPARLASAFAHARRHYPVGFGVVSLLARNNPDGLDPALEWAQQLADLGVPVGLGLAGDERANPISAFDRSADRAQQAGFAWVPHAGEFPGQAPELRYALGHQAPSRIAHGWTAVGDPALVQALAERQVCLDIAPCSNVRLGVCSMREHPIQQLIRAGVPISLSTDNPLMIRHDLLRELMVAGRFLGASKQARFSIGPSGVSFVRGRSGSLPGG